MTGPSKASKSPTGLLSFEPNSLLQAADVQIASLEYSRATKEAPWDGKALQRFCPARSGQIAATASHCGKITGYCGLVKVGEEEYGQSSAMDACDVREDSKPLQRQ